jgi:hypothetical protein
MAPAFMAGCGLAVANGSYMPQSSIKLGLAAWLIIDLATGAWCNGMVQTSGKEKEVNPYHSELQGIHTVLMWILAIYEFHQINSGHVVVCCDNEKAL